MLIENPLTITNPSTGVIIDKASRLQLVNKFFNDKDMNIGLSSFAQIDKMAQEVFCKKGFLKQRASFEEILYYKYLIVVDGNTFASQLPWSLHSRSLVLMVPPAWESIIHGVTAWEHYVPLASDFSDLKEKIEWCRLHDSQCYGISRSATDLMRSHYSTQHEHMIQQLMIERYAENFPSL
ncbi:MAG: glycosyl transferase family 90 [bacterium]